MKEESNRAAHMNNYVLVRGRGVSLVNLLR